MWLCSPTNAEFLRRATLEVKDLPLVSSAILLSSQGVASLPDALTPLSSDSLTAWSTIFWISTPEASYSSGIGTAISTPFFIRSCCCESDKIRTSESTLYYTTALQYLTKDFRRCKWIVHIPRDLFLQYHSDSGTVFT